MSALLKLPSSAHRGNQTLDFNLTGMQAAIQSTPHYITTSYGHLATPGLAPKGDLKPDVAELQEFSSQRQRSWFFLNKQSLLILSLALLWRLIVLAFAMPFTGTKSQARESNNERKPKPRLEAFGNQRLVLYMLSYSPEHIIESHEAGVTAVAVTPDGKRLISHAFDDNMLCICDLNSGELLRSVPPKKGESTGMPTYHIRYILISLGGRFV